MKTRIMNDLKEFYLKHRETIHILLVEQKMRDVCDAYYMDELTVRQISQVLTIDIHQVNGRLLSACSIMVRYKGEILDGGVIK